jgi:hypothetical protein
MRNSSALLSADGSASERASDRCTPAQPCPALYHRGIGGLPGSVLLSWVAFDKNKPPAAQSEDHGGNTDSYAAQVVGNKVGYFPRKIAEHQPRRLRRPQ